MTGPERHETMPWEAAVAEAPGSVEAGLLVGTGTRTNPSLQRGATWLTAAGIGVGGLNYLYSLLLTYRLTSAGYSEFAAGQALLIVGGTIAGASAPWVLAFELSRNRDNPTARRQAVTFAALINLGQGVASGAAFAGIASRFAPAPVVALVAGSALVVFMATTVVGYLQGLGRFKAIAALRVVEVVAKVGSGFAAVLLGFGAAGALAGVFVSDAALVIIGCWIMRSDIRPALGGLRQMALWERAAGLAGIQAFVAVIANLDTVLVAILPIPKADAATYQVAAILSRVPLFFSQAISMVAFEALARRDGDDSAIIKRTTKMYVIAAGAGALVVSTIPGAIIRAVFPPSYGHIRVVLVFTAFAGFAYGVANVLSTCYQAQLRFRRCLILLSAAAIWQFAAILVGDSLDGSRGVAIAALLGASLLAMALGTDTLRTWSLAWRPRPTAWVATAVALGIGLVVVHQPVAWSLIAVLALAIAGWRGLLGNST